jgi:hypothetical protein
MKAMMPHALRTVLFVLITAPATLAQTTVSHGSYGFSDGIHPTFDFTFEGTDAKYVEAFWRDELKRISRDVTSRKEVIAGGALLPQVSPDTVRVLVKAEQRKGAGSLTAHVAILTTQGYLGPTGKAAAVAAAMAFVQERSTALRRQLVQQQLADAEKGLVRLRSELANLQREKERAESSIEKCGQRGAGAVKEQERTRKELEELDKRVETRRNEVAASPSEEGTKELNALLKERTRTQEKSRKAMELEHDMKKKVEDLTFAIRKNTEDQGRKQEEVARQELLVASLQEKLTAIH